MGTRKVLTCYAHFMCDELGKERQVTTMLLKILQQPL